MSRLKRTGKPRTKKKEVVMTVKFSFESVNDNEDEAKLDCKRFKQWMKDQFTEWDSSILQYFLYAYKLQQDAEDASYLLDVHIDKIIKDESATLSEQKEFMDEVMKNEEPEKDENNEEFL